ncbi:cytidylyltransferase domain-containing protein [Hwanghaeella sp.]|uniref:acylneuraminate cytidylyltransferase family protein n=1 Tax=Hwanghaeella sp. TaxID=2605943 RepID=UPI003CCC214C
MTRKPRIVAMIPARGGSKSVPYKNLEMLGDRPLLAWPIETAKQAPEIGEVYVSTDDDRIAAVARDYGAEVIRRPDALATDSALVIDAIRHLRDVLERDGDPIEVMVLLEATSPFREAGLVSRCINRLLDEELDSIATFHQADINPERTWRVEDGAPRPFIDGAIPWKPRQQLTPAYQLNGAVYAFRPGKLPEDSPSLLYGKMGAEIVSASSVIDIDEKEDFVRANAILSARNSS